jgi:hypothetical protein
MKQILLRAWMKNSFSFAPGWDVISIYRGRVTQVYKNYEKH